MNPLSRIQAINWLYFRQLQTNHGRIPTPLPHMLVLLIWCANGKGKLALAFFFRVFMSFQMLYLLIRPFTPSNDIFYLYYVRYKNTHASHPKHIFIILVVVRYYVSFNKNKTYVLDKGLGCFATTNAHIEKKTFYRIIINWFKNVGRLGDLELKRYKAHFIIMIHTTYNLIF